MALDYLALSTPAPQALEQPLKTGRPLGKDRVGSAAPGRLRGQGTQGHSHSSMFLLGKGKPTIIR